MRSPPSRQVNGRPPPPCTFRPAAWRWTSSGPQLLRALWPALAAEAVVLLRDSTLASLVGVGDIAFVAQSTAQQGPGGLAALGAAAALYLALDLPLAVLSRRAGPRLRAGAAR